MNNEKLVLTIDAIKDFLFCRRLYDYRHYRRLTSGKINSDRFLELIVRESLKLWYDGMYLKNVMEWIERRYEIGRINFVDREQWDDDFLQMIEKINGRWLASSMIEGYAKWISHIDIKINIKEVSLDDRMIVPIRNIKSGRKSNNLYIDVTIDLLGEEDGHLMLLIWEIASEIGENYKKWLNNNIKLPLLAYAVAESTGKNVDKFDVRILRKSFPVVDDKQISCFDRVVIDVVKNKSFIATLDDIYWVAKEIWDCSRNIERNAFYKNSFNCKYKGCEYYRLCRSGEDMKELEKFKIREETDYGKLIKAGKK